MLTSKPDINVVSLDADVHGKTRNEVVAAALSNAEKYASGHDMNNAPMVYVRDIDKQVIVGKKGVEHGLGVQDLRRRQSQFRRLVKY